MRWTTDYVWSKIESLVPTARICGDSIPEALKWAAVELLILEENQLQGSWRAYVIAECLKELRQIGYLTEGSVAEDWNTK